MRKIKLNSKFEFHPNYRGQASCSVKYNNFLHKFCIGISTERLVATIRRCPTRLSLFHCGAELFSELVFDE